jgi:hypothetical protein
MKKLLLAAVLFAAMFTSCKKEDIITYSSNTLVTGLWIGKFTTVAYNNNYDWVALIKSDGTCRIFESKITDTSANNVLNGVYNISDGNLKIQVKFPTSSLLCKYEGVVVDKTFSGTVTRTFLNGAGVTINDVGSCNLVKQ